MIPEVFSNLLDSLTRIDKDHTAKQHLQGKPKALLMSFSLSVLGLSHRNTFLSKHRAGHLILEEQRLHCTAAEDVRPWRGHGPRKKTPHFLQNNAGEPTASLYSGCTGV